VPRDGRLRLDEYLEAERRALDDALGRTVAPLGTTPAILHEAMR
jgi:hypothetical protein